MSQQPPRGELSSLATMLDEVTSRVAGLAEEAAGDDNAVGAELFEIERALQGASRRLAKLVAELP